MPTKPSSGILWLLLGLATGFVSFVLLAGGGYWIYHAHANVKANERIVDEDLVEKNKSKPLRDRPRSEKLPELSERGEIALKDLQVAESQRVYAVIVAVTSTVPGFLAFAFLAMFAVKLMKKRAAATAKAEDEDEDEEDNTPPNQDGRSPRFKLHFSSRAIPPSASCQRRSPPGNRARPPRR